MMDQQFQVDPVELRTYAARRRAEATELFLEKSAPVVADDDDDPTRSAQREVNAGVDAANKGFHRRSHRTADTIDQAGQMYQNMDTQSAAQVTTMSSRDQAAIFSGTFKDLSSAVSGSISSAVSAIGAGSSALASAAGALGNAGTQIITNTAQTMSKMGMDHLGVPVGGAAAGLTAGTATAGGGDTSPSTKAAAATGSPTSPRAVAGAATAEAGLPPGYGRTEDQDRDDALVRPAGLVPWGAGVGALGGGTVSGVRAGRVHSAKIVTAGSTRVDDDAETVEIPVITRPAVHVPAPVQEKIGGLDA